MSRAAGKITVDFVKAINKAVTNKVYRDSELNITNLTSALDRPGNREYMCEKYRMPTPSVAELAASLAFGLTKNHAFPDGNKRTTHRTVEEFLKVYGYRFSSGGDQEIEDAHLKVANGEIGDDEELAKIYAKHIKKAHK